MELAALALTSITSTLRASLLLVPTLALWRLQELATAASTIIAAASIIVLAFIYLLVLQLFAVATSSILDSLTL